MDWEWTKEVLLWASAIYLSLSVLMTVVVMRAPVMDFPEEQEWDPRDDSPNDR